MQNNQLDKKVDPEISSGETYFHAGINTFPHKHLTFWQLRCTWKILCAGYKSVSTPNKAKPNYTQFNQYIWMQVCVSGKGSSWFWHQN